MSNLNRARRIHLGSCWLCYVARTRQKQRCPGRANERGFSSPRRHDNPNERNRAAESFANFFIVVVVVVVWRKLL